MSEKITVENKKLNVPNNPIIPFITGDGIGSDITKAMQIVIDAAVEKAYNGKKKIEWKKVLAGEEAFEKTGEYLPQETLDVLEDYIVSIKGPLATPVGGGIRSLNVTIRQKLDLYACVRPVRYFKGVPSPLKSPEKTNVVIFRENTEDVYSGIEWEQGSEEVNAIIKYLVDTYGVNIRPDSGIGIKPISITGSKQIVRKAINYAIEHKAPSVTLIHKGNIMKFTEGAFKKWGYEVAAEEFGDVTITEAELWDKYDGKAPEGKIVIKDRIADNMFQQIVLRPEEYHVLVTPNLNGDYLSDACAAQVGGLGMAPGGNIGDYIAVFEATHGTAPKYTNMDKANPGSLILSAVMMLEYMGWQEAADKVVASIEKTILKKTVTYDLARQTEGATELKASEYAAALVENM